MTREEIIKNKANLRYSNLSYSNLSYSDLSYSNLSNSNLSYSDLSYNNLRYSDLRGSNLRGSDLRGSNLRGSNLRGSDLRGSNIDGAKLPAFQIPQDGTLTVYKKVEGKIVKLLIPARAKRTASLVGRKCRAEYAKVLNIEGKGSVTTRGLTYSIGSTVYPDSYDDDVRVECTHGIHFFLTRAEAEEYRR